MEKLKVAIVGGGMIANAAHIPAWKDVPGVDVAAVMDVSAERAAATAARHGIARSYDDVAKMLAQVCPDAVSVCSPAAYHKEQTMAALEAGAHVWCEKPVAPLASDAEAMFDAAARNGRQLFIGQSMRFYDHIMAAHDHAAAGELGEMYCAQAARLRRRGVPTHGMFHMRSHSAGGVLYDTGSHMLDTILWIMGNPTVVAASGTTFRKLAERDEKLTASAAEGGAFAGVFEPRPFDAAEFDVEEMASAYLRLAGGGVVSFQVSWAANVSDTAGGVWITGTEGGVQFDPRERALRIVKNVDGQPADTSPTLPPQENTQPFYAHWKAAAHFARAIRGKEPLMVRREEVLNCARALEAIYRSAAEGREIRLDKEAQ